MKKKITEYDEHIIEALRRLPSPIVGKNGKLYFIRKDARNETGMEHIAKKSHRLKVRDIESIESILKHPEARYDDPIKRNYRNYYGIRRGENKKSLLKIVTHQNEYNEKIEEIITLYPTKNIKIN